MGFLYPLPRRWREWCPAIRKFAAEHDQPKFFMFGEVLHASDAVCAAYVGTTGERGAKQIFKLDSVLDYPLYMDVNSVFAETTASPASANWGQSGSRCRICSWRRS